MMKTNTAPESRKLSKSPRKHKATKVVKIPPKTRSRESCYSPPMKLSCVKEKVHKPHEAV